MFYANSYLIGNTSSIKGPSFFVIEQFIQFLNDPDDGGDRKSTCRDEADIYVYKYIYACLKMFEQTRA